MSIAVPKKKWSVRKIKDSLFGSFCVLSIAIAGLLLAYLLYTVIRDGWPRLSVAFLQNNPSRMAGRAGLFPALMGTLWVISFTAIVAVPIGIAAAIFLEEFNTRRTKLTDFIQLNISNLAGVPSIVYGLLGLALFVRWMDLGRSVIAGALTMALLILPMIIIVSQEALRAVPSSFREASYGLGSTKWQMIRSIVLPNALPGILTGIILSLARAIGETAPLITVGAVLFITAPPAGLSSKFTVMPYQIYDWSSRPDKDFQYTAAAGILVLMAVLMVMNATAIYFRGKANARKR